MSHNRSTLRERVQHHSAYARFAVVASLSAAAAYLLASALPTIASVPAALAAVVSVRPSFHEGLREAAVQILATLAGGLMAAALVVTFGASAATMAGAVFAAFAVGWLLKVDTTTAATIAATIIIVIGTNATVDAVWGRLWGVAIGALIAVLASLYASPGVPSARTLDAAITLALRLAAQLEHIGGSLHGHSRGTAVTVPDVRRWLSTIETIGRDLEPVRDDAELLVQGSGWSPLTRQEDAKAVLRQVMLIEVASETSANMCRDLLLTPPAAMPPSLLDPIGDVFTASARLLRDQLALAQEQPSARLPASDSGADAHLMEAQQRTLSQVRELDETAPLTLGSSVTRDALKIRMLLAQQGDATGAAPVDSGEDGAVKPTSTS